MTKINRKKANLFLFTLFLLGLTCLSSLSGLAEPPASSLESGLPETYVIGPGDNLMINVWKVPELTGPYNVGPDGMISMPLIGEVLAAGESRKSLAAKIAKRLSGEYKNPIVSVHVVQYLSHYVYVVGRVARPGILVFPDDPTLIKAISLAGGVAEPSQSMTGKSFLSSMGKASIIRGGNQIIIVDLDELLLHGKMELNQQLKPGDIINVYKETDAYIYVMGEVRDPGLYELRTGMTVLDAIAAAGGYTPDAQAHSVRVVRYASKENPEIVQLDLYDVMKRDDKKQNVLLYDKDIVFMPVKGVAKFSYYVGRTVPSITTIIFGYTAGENLKKY